MQVVVAQVAPGGGVLALMGELRAEGVGNAVESEAVGDQRFGAGLAGFEQVDRCGEVAAQAADERKVFAEGLNLVSGLEVGFGGVWVGAAPYLMFIPDRNGDDVPDGVVTSFPMAVKCQPDETVVFSWISWPSREVRDAGMAKVMADPRMQPGAEPMPFDGKRMVYGGFIPILSLGKTG